MLALEWLHDLHRSDLLASQHKVGLLEPEDAMLWTMQILYKQHGNTPAMKPAARMLASHGHTGKQTEHNILMAVFHK